MLKYKFIFQKKRSSEETLTVRESPTAATTLISPGLSSWTTHRIKWMNYISPKHVTRIWWLKTGKKQAIHGWILKSCLKMGELSDVWMGRVPGWGTATPGLVLGPYCVNKNIYFTWGGCCRRRISVCARNLCAHKLKTHSEHKFTCTCCDSTP